MGPTPLWKTSVGVVDLAVIILGSNDFVQGPDNINEIADEAVQIGHQLISSLDVRQIACIVQVFLRYGPLGFVRAHPKFRPVKDITTQKDYDELFACLAGNYNIRIQHQIHVYLSGGHVPQPPK